MAQYGQAPVGGPGLVDGVWLGQGPGTPGGLSGGQNNAYISGLTAAGAAQATATAMADGYKLYEFDTVASSTGAALPTAFAGRELKIYNKGAQTLTVYPAVANNPITAAQDTINNTTSKTIAQYVSVTFWCAKDGVWAAQ